jgi:gliding motility-associated-like protein
MCRRKPIIFFFTLIILFFKIGIVWAQQPPNITYPANSTVLIVGKVVTLAPANTGGSATGYTVNAAPYSPLGAGLQLPPGIGFDQTTGIFSGTPPTVWPLTTYTVIASNAYGTSLFNVIIEVLSPTITLGPIPTKALCDNDFYVDVISMLPLTFQSSNIAVATITAAGAIHIAGPGTTIITAANTETSVSQTLTVVVLTPSITISPDSLDVCPGSQANFTATPINGGNNPVYQWRVNGVNTGVNSPTFSSSGLRNNDKITCKLTSNAPCTLPDTALSNTATFILHSSVTSSITITTSANTVCPGLLVTFTATAVTPDSILAYQWQVNGINKGSNSRTFTSSQLTDGDIITCDLITTSKCGVNTARSNAISLIAQSGCVVTIPNAFTPNGDGINDYWNIPVFQKNKYFTVNVYNRYGTLVFSSIGYGTPWDGTYNGKSLPVGTYYYIIDPKNGGNKLTGSVTILR